MSLSRRCFYRFRETRTPCFEILLAKISPYSTAFVSLLHKQLDE